MYFILRSLKPSLDRKIMASGPLHLMTPPPSISTDLKVSFPQEHVLLLTFNRPDKRNVINDVLSREIGNVLAWFDEEPGLWYACSAFHSFRRE